MPSKQNLKAIDNWKRENTDLIRVRVRKHEHLIERVQMAVDGGFGKSRQAYILDAIRAALERDGIPEIISSTLMPEEASGEADDEDADA